VAGSPRGTGGIPVVEMVRITRVYSGPVPVHALRDASITLCAGDYIALTGPSGSGKSTLANLIALLDRPTSGRYLLAGSDTDSLADPERTALRGREIGMVFQQFHLLPYRTAIENVALAGLYAGVPRHIRRARAAEVLRQVRMSHRADAFPSTLSGGEQQRVAVARALALRPSLLVCDEPTGSLDGAATADLLALLSELRRANTAIVVITHDAAVAGCADSVLTIRDGVVASISGTR
jgi:putative ABC transport system ATP-binding protein